mgnify:CR=1 FL=1
MSSRLLKTVAEVTRTVSVGSAFQQSMRRQANEKARALLTKWLNNLKFTTHGLIKKI